MTYFEEGPSPLVGEEAEHALEQAEHRLGGNVRALRQRQRLSQADLARRMGYSRTTVGNIELAERRITLGDLWALCRGLQVSLAELLDGTGVEDDLGLGSEVVETTLPVRTTVGQDSEAVRLYAAAALGTSPPVAVEPRPQSPRQADIVLQKDDVLQIIEVKIAERVKTIESQVEGLRRVLLEKADRNVEAATEAAREDMRIVLAEAREQARAAVEDAEAARTEARRKANRAAKVKREQARQRGEHTPQEA